MVIYIKLEKEGEVQQFTTGLEAKEYIRGLEMKEGAFMAIHRKPPKDPQLPEYSQYNRRPEMIESIQQAVIEFSRPPEQGEVEPEQNESGDGD